MTYEELTKKLKEAHPRVRTVKIKAHGRIEIIGNHTDHNNGKCLVGSCSLGTYGVLAKNSDNIVEVVSIGYPAVKLDANCVEFKKEEKGTTTSLVKGVIRGFIEAGFNVGGFYLYVDSDIFEGAGVSSSACFESLICKALSYLYNGDKITPLQMAKISQYAENEYFGKPCGMLDQIGACFGGVCYLDFADNEVSIFPVQYRLPLDVVLINTGGSHAKLTPLYASIPEDMKSVAKAFGKKKLGELTEDEWKKFNTKKVRGFSKTAKARATHFYEENLRVDLAREALEKRKTDTFIDLIRQTQFSSQNLLKNTMVPKKYEGSPQEAVDRANKIIKRGAARIMGGGFAGSIICFVSKDETNGFIKKMSAIYGPNHVVLTELPAGGAQIIKE